MFPNNCFFVKRECAQAIDYYASGIAGNACDYHFGLRMGQQGHPYWLCDEFTADYRMTKHSVLRSASDNSGYFSFKLATDMIGEVTPSPKVDESLKRTVKVAIMQGVSIDPVQAWKWYFSKWHRGSILSLGGLHRFACLLMRRVV